MNPLPDETPEEISLGRAPQHLLDYFEHVFAEQQKLTAELMRVADRIYGSARVSDQEFVGDELALLMNCHPDTGRTFTAKSWLACAVPGLMAAMGAGELTERHVQAASAELHGSLPDSYAREVVLEAVLTRCRSRAAEGKRWPFPGELARMLRKEALAYDPITAERRRKKTRDDRCVSITPLPDGASSLAITGPAEQVAAINEAIDAVAGTLAGPGDERTLEQLRFDAAYALNTSPLRGGLVDDASVPLGLGQVIVPISTALGGDLEVGELVGYGPLLPSTCRDLLERAEEVQRVFVDAGTGQLLGMDAPAPNDGEWLGWMLTQPVTIPLPRTAPDGGATLEGCLAQGARPAGVSGPGAYRPAARMISFVKNRDRTCRFPGCRRQARICDVDHRTAWPLGPTAECNLQCLCRHHHRAKQSSLFTCELDPDGSTVVWTTRTGRTYRVPPPDW